MEQQLIQKIEEQQVKIDKMYASVEKLRKYFLWTMVITIALFVLPLVGLVFALPSFIANYVEPLSGAGLGL